MQKSVLEVNVTTTDGHIEGPNYKDGSDDMMKMNSITISLDMVDILIQWLKEAKEGLQNKSENVKTLLASSLRSARLFLPPAVTLLCALLAVSCAGRQQVPKLSSQQALPQTTLAARLAREGQARQALAQATSGTWQYSLVEASIHWSNGIPYAINSWFCVLPGTTGVSVSLEGGATSALVSNATNFVALASGYQVLPDGGCYELAVGSWYSYNEIPLARVTYAERVSVSNVSMGGKPQKEYVKAGSDPVLPPATNLGDLHDRVLIDIYGLDDTVIFRVNGQEVRRYPYSKWGTYDITQRVLSGQARVEIEFLDNNKGECWDAGFRIGDVQSWRFSDHYANTPCGTGLPSGTKTVYRKTLEFTFVR